MFSCDIGNSYLNLKCREKLWTEAVTQFGTEKGMVIIISIVLYVRKSYGAAWRGKLSETLISLGYKSFEAYDSVWMKWKFKPNEDPYKYMLCYFDDLLHIGFNPK